MFDDDAASNLDTDLMASRSVKDHTRAVLCLAAKLAVRRFALGLAIVGVVLTFEYFRKVFHW